MNARVFLTAGRRLKWLAPLLVLMLVAGVAQPGERYRIPEDTLVPYHLRILWWPGYTDWAAVVFYRDPASVPDEFEMWARDVTFDWSLQNNDSLLMEGFLIRETLVPYQSQLRDVKGTPVPIWFVKMEDLLNAANPDPENPDWMLTFAELKAIPRLEGSADSFLEVLHPGGGANVPKINIVTSGVLEDGRSFFMLYEDTNTPFLTETILRFGD